MERNEAIDRVRQLYADANDENRKPLIPDLKDSEDERIRKEIRTLYNEIDSCIDELLKARTDKDTEAEGKALFKMEGLMVATLQDLSCIEDYLEKRKGQKPELPLMKGDADLYFNEWKKHYQGSPTKRKCFEEGMRYAQRLQKPAEDITDIDERNKEFVRDFNVFAANLAKQFHITHRCDIEWHNFCAGLLTYLKFNRPAEWKWKPSEWQMAMLRAVLNDNNNMGSESANLALKSLYSDLQKLI